MKWREGRKGERVGNRRRGRESGREGRERKRGRAVTCWDGESMRETEGRR